MMESIYWVLTFACHRRCVHCYDDRFRPYLRGDFARVVEQGRAAYAKIIDNLPDDFAFRDKQGVRKRGQLILAGGELLLDGVREELLYPALEAIGARYGARAPRLGVQTTGDVLTLDHVREMIARGVRTISIASVDDFHAGMEGDRKFRLMEKVRRIMREAGVEEVTLGGKFDKRLNLPATKERADPDAPCFLFFGAQPDLWIGELWPRGRAFANGLSKATYADNFCARWSGGKNFLDHGEAGSEVAIEPDGSVYPCCLKTKAPLGNLTEERLTDILDDLRGEPAMQAINAGDPEAMGITHGWTRGDFERRAEAADGAGVMRKNFCLGCDAFFEEKLGALLRARRAARLEARPPAGPSQGKERRTSAT